MIPRIARDKLQCMKQPILITVAAAALIAYDLTADIPEWIRELWLAGAITVPVFVWAAEIIQRTGDFPDDNQTSDHRPVRADFTIP